jgi:hypothetical protein
MNVLAHGPVAVKTIETDAAARGFSVDQLRRVKRKMGIVTFKEEGRLEGGWFWALPHHAESKNP